ncbi:mRNA polyadenylation-like protein, putative [Rhizoctonia solani AG-3 Rhs1AP]|uniref:mRNA polyadenylation-like protein, putative n=1 Tax=Rhizoctonia solani AG-3 Rhs1AP TaxID=1086054 RepID=X8JA24_9AGAM|nr:mRNA polyadenylation-like protein, putative [Rhizoctonia solani AG-3 Rhs1AP]
MASSVYWKFKSQKGESRVTFDGPTISVSDLKREIILQNNLVSSASDFDLLIFDPTTEQEYKDDNHQIARSTSVLAKRLPAARPGKGKAAQYVLGINPSDIPRPDSTNVGANRPIPKPQEPTRIVVPEGTSADEAAGIAAMFQASQEIWDETQEKMAQATPVYTNRGGFRGGKPFNQGTRGQDGARQQDSRPVPPGYICYRCAKRGHWIHDCPTNDDRDWDNRPRVKRTTGIPRSFLKTVEQTSDGPLGQGVMVTPDGGFVVAQPDSVAWQKQRARPKALTSTEIYQNSAPPAHSSLACPICDRLTKNAIRTPCCKQTFCEECIQTHLLEHDFVCRCGKKIASFDRLEADERRREKVGEVVRAMIEESRKESAKQEIEESQPSPSASSTPTPAPTITSEKPAILTPPAPTNTGPDLADLQAQMAQLSQMLSNPGLPQQAKQQAQRQAAKIGAEIQKIMNAGDGGMQMGMGPNMGMGGGMGGGMGMGPGMGMGGGNMGMGGMGIGGPMGGMGMNGMGMPGNMNMGMNGMGMGMGMGMNNMGMGMGPGMRMPPNMGMGMNNMGMPMGGMGMMGMGGPMGMNNMGMGMMPGPGPNPMMNPHQNWTNPYANQQPLGNESAYQRLPVHNRRKKRDRPSDFVEVGGEQNKVPRYWE